MRRCRATVISQRRKSGIGIVNQIISEIYDVANVINRIACTADVSGNNRVSGANRNSQITYIFVIDSRTCKTVRLIMRDCRVENVKRSFGAVKNAAASGGCRAVAADGRIDNIGKAFVGQSAREGSRVAVL